MVILPDSDKVVAAIREAAPSLYVSVEDGESYAGSGALPIKTIPSRVVVVVPPGELGAAAAARQLRLHDVPVFARVKAECLLFDPRTIQPGEDATIVQRQLFVAHQGVRRKDILDAPQEVVGGGEHVLALIEQRP